MRLRISKIILLGLITNSDIHANEPTTTSPAHFGESAPSIVNSFEFPKVEGHINQFVTCAAYVWVNGKIGSPICQRDSENEWFVREVMGRVWGKKISPARIDGKGRLVWFQFSVWFQRDDSGERVILSPNNGAEMSRLGQSYISAQGYGRVLAKFPLCVVRANNAWVEVVITANGTPKDSKVIRGQLSPSCTNRLLKYVLSRKYIPAFSENKPVESRLVEWYGKAKRNTRM
ncbi:MAG: hypothetical protein GKR90_17730 [Pseudomonadales bacterium]|nr:hypothetical protein [Pseudomonadales bacterium]